MGSDIQPGVMSAQKSEIQIIRVTYFLIKIFRFSVRKIIFMSLYMELGVFFAII
jgi:hypothetical protein